MNHLVVSVIIPCYNYAHYLPETLDSVLTQTHQKWECIIVDDGSTDNTREVSLEYCKKDLRFRYIYQQNKGLSAARNTGISNAKGLFIQLLDADDLIESKKLEIQIGFLIKNPEIDIVFGDSIFFEDNNTGRVFSSCPHPDEPQNYIKVLKDFKTHLIQKNRFPPCAPLLRKTIFHNIGMFNEKLFSMEDWDFWLRCAFSNVRFAYLTHENTNALVRQTNSSMRANKWKMSYFEIVVRSNQISKLNKTQIEINKKVLLDRLKTALYSVTNQSNINEKQEKLYALYRTTRNKKIIILRCLFNIFPCETHPKLVWLLFESKIIAIKTKMAC